MLWEATSDGRRPFVSGWLERVLHGGPFRAAALKEAAAAREAAETALADLESSTTAGQLAALGFATIRESRSSCCGLVGAAGQRDAPGVGCGQELAACARWWGMHVWVYVAGEGGVAPTLCPRPSSLHLPPPTPPQLPSQLLRLKPRQAVLSQPKGKVPVCGGGRATAGHTAQCSAQRWRCRRRGHGRVSWAAPPSAGGIQQRSARDSAPWAHVLCARVKVPTQLSEE